MVLGGILVTWGELLSSFNLPPWTPFPLPPVPTPWCTQAECSVRRVSTERPLCVLTKAECPGDKRGRSGLKAHKARGRRGEEGGGDGRREGTICWRLNTATQPPKNSKHPKNLHVAVSPSAGLPQVYLKLLICFQPFFKIYIFKKTNNNKNSKPLRVRCY